MFGIFDGIAEVFAFKPVSRPATAAEKRVLVRQKQAQLEAQTKILNDALDAERIREHRSHQLQQQSEVVDREDKSRRQEELDEAARLRQLSTDLNKNVDSAGEFTNAQYFALQSAKRQQVAHVAAIQKDELNAPLRRQQLETELVVAQCEEADALSRWSSGDIKSIHQEANDIINTPVIVAIDLSSSDTDEVGFTDLVKMAENEAEVTLERLEVRTAAYQEANRVFTLLQRSTTRLQTADERNQLATAKQKVARATREYHTAKLAAQAAKKRQTLAVTKSTSGAHKAATSKPQQTVHTSTPATALASSQSKKEVLSTSTPEGLLAELALKQEIASMALRQRDAFEGSEIQRRNRQSVESARHEQAVAAAEIAHDNAQAAERKAQADLDAVEAARRQHKHTMEAAEKARQKRQAADALARRQEVTVAAEAAEKIRLLKQAVAVFAHSVKNAEFHYHKLAEAEWRAAGGQGPYQPDSGFPGSTTSGGGSGGTAGGGAGGGGGGGGGGARSSSSSLPKINLTAEMRRRKAQFLADFIMQKRSREYAAGRLGGTFDAQAAEEEAEEAFYRRYFPSHFAASSSSSSSKTSADDAEYGRRREAEKAINRRRLDAAFDKLGLSNRASVEEIKQAYKRLALKYHPDRNRDEGAEELFKDINDAYSKLSAALF